MVSLLFGVAAVVFGGLLASDVLGQIDATPHWFTAAGVAAVLGLPVLLSIVSFVVPTRILRAIAAAIAVGYAASLVCLPIVHAPTGTAGSAPWLLQLAAIATTAASIAWPSTVAWLYLIVCAVLIAVDRVLTGSSALIAVAVQDASYAAFYCSVFVALCLGARAAGASVDRAAAETATVAAQAAALSARDAERARVDALVHDRLLATLLLAGRSDGGVTTALVVNARSALERLREFATPDTGPVPDTVPASRLIDRLRLAMPSLVARGSDELDLPNGVVDAICDAVDEAARNVARHTTDQTMEVSVRFERGTVTVVVRDGGPGFNPKSTADGRLGIRSSIVGRMQAVGGDAQIESAPGAGTTVRLDWPAP